MKNGCCEARFLLGAHPREYEVKKQAATHHPTAQGCPGQATPTGTDRSIPANTAATRQTMPSTPKAGMQTLSHTTFTMAKVWPTVQVKRRTVGKHEVELVAIRDTGSTDRNGNNR